MSRYQLAIFDFDGTLADTFDWFRRAVTLAAQRYRFRVALEHEVELLRSLDARRIARHLGIPTWKMPFIANFMRQHMARELSAIRLFPGVDEALRELRDAGLTLAIVTSNAQDNVRQILGPELWGLFSHVSCGAALFGKRSKLRGVLRRAACHPERAIYVGDEIRDLHAARSAGLHFGAVSWGYTLPHGFTPHAPEWVFSTADQLSRGLLGDDGTPGRTT